jgi:hypothetical protein
MSENLTVSIRCIKCKKLHTIAVARKDYDAWINGALIQNVMPYLSLDQRELLISKICGKCFDKMFGKE